MEAHNFVTIDSWGKFRASAVPLNTGNDGTAAGLPQALDRGTRSDMLWLLLDENLAST